MVLKDYPHSDESTVPAVDWRSIQMNHSSPEDTLISTTISHITATHIEEYEKQLEALVVTLFGSVERFKELADAYILEETPFELKRIPFDIGEYDEVNFLISSQVRIRLKRDGE